MRCSRRCAGASGTERGQGVVERGADRAVDLVVAHHRVVPGVVVDDVHVAARAALPLAAQHAELLEVAHRPGDPGRADVERGAQLGRGHPAVVVDQQRGEHPGRQPGQPGLGERAADPLDRRLLGGRHESHSTSFRKI